MINLDNLILTDTRASGICIYGPPGMRKTLSLWSAPPPILLCDFEGGASSLLPWIRRARNYNSPHWRVYTDEVRAAAFARVDPRHRKSYHTANPGPLIDVISYQNTDVGAWGQFTLDVANFNPRDYNTIAIDSIREYSEGSKTFARGLGNEAKVMNDVPFAWVGAQERAQQIIRRLRDLRAAGVYVILLSQQDIVKDYVFSPMAKAHKNEEPIAVSGTVNAPGQLANAITHVVDILLHARMLNAAPTWVAKPEPLPGGSAWWDAKDRYGALPEYNTPNFYNLIASIATPNFASAIYNDAYALLSEQNAQIFHRPVVADTAIADTQPQPASDTEPSAEVTTTTV